MQTERARELRKNQTDVEQFVWRGLRNHRFSGFKFRRQVPIGPFIVDLVCFDKRLILELDGGQHAQQKEYDSQRTAWLQQQGFRVLRFWNYDVFTSWDAIEEVIWGALKDHPSPPT